MKFRRKYTITSLIVFMIFFLSANLYFVQILFNDKRIDSDESTKPEVKKTSIAQPAVATSHIKFATIYATKKIKEKLNFLSSKYYKRNKISYSVLKHLFDDLNETLPLSSGLFSIADKWATPEKLVPTPAPALGSLLRSLCTSRIVKAEISGKGTQLKLMLTLEGGKFGLFKPQWYERNEVLWGPSFGGKDRHNGEVAAFHLSLLLGLPRVPITVGRRLHLPLEIVPVATNALGKTFINNGSATCFYGVCLYCTPKEPVCGKTLDHLGGGPYLEGALSLWLPPNLLPLQRHRSPWQRTYQPGKLARWEVNKDYCLRIREGQHLSAGKLFSGSGRKVQDRLLDLVDASIFDFLIGNGDRHHVETFQRFSNSMVLLIDNGKSFGNPYDDHLDILAPLYQCCILRHKTWERLLLLSGGVLGEALERLLRPSHLAPLLSPPHYVALNRRLLHVYAAVETCLDNKTMESVIIDS
ncbi:glycosaminoglycan xylosylkinase [Ischnura elegans]|uniref:glycosaminoglycan xylosylkinase n=1 Tax=Ischnura elegans TaxID=197161 RepID=UPI001ED866F8|nr:glycosaminoglycan xylosylkinase [Ischnura elegans]